jgi:hypothetical protein
MLKIVSVPVASWITAAPVTPLMVTEKLLVGPGLVQGRIGYRDRELGTPCWDRGGAFRIRVDDLLDLNACLPRGNGTVRGVLASRMSSLHALSPIRIGG